MGPNREAAASRRVFAYIAARRAVRKLYAETHAARNHRDLLRLHLKHAQFGGDTQRALLRHDQQFAVRIVEVTALHGAVGGVQMDADAVLRGRRTVAGHSEQTFHEILRRFRQRQRGPAQLIGRHRAGFEVVMEIRLHERREGTVHRRRPDPIQPAALVLRARRGESGAGQLFGVQAVGDRCGELRPTGKVPASASVAKWLAKPDWYLSLLMIGLGLRLSPLRRERGWGEGPVYQ